MPKKKVNIIFEKPYGKLEYYPEDNYCYAYIDPKVAIEEKEYREIYEIVLFSMKRYSCDSLLSQTDVNTTEANKKWLIHDWLPRALKIGYRKSARIVRKSTYRKMSIKEITGRIKFSNFEVGHFLTMEEAITWLMEKKEEEKSQTSS